MLKLNLGCGDDYKEGFVNVDKDPAIKTDLVHDVSERMPFKDNSVDEIQCFNILEHLSNFVEVMFDLYRVLKEGGILIISVPEFPCRACVGDPTHQKLFIMETFFMFCHPEVFKASNFIGAGMFDVEDARRIFWDYEDGRKPGSYYTEIRITLKKVSPDYWKTEREKRLIFKEGILKR